FLSGAPAGLTRGRPEQFDRAICSLGKGAGQRRRATARIRARAVARAEGNGGPSGATIGAMTTLGIRPYLLHLLSALGVAVSLGASAHVVLTKRDTRAAIGW